jgi:hypothetical protein
MTVARDFRWAFKPVARQFTVRGGDGGGKTVRRGRERLESAPRSDARVRETENLIRTKSVEPQRARRQLHLPTGDNYTSPSLRPAGQ